MDDKLVRKDEVRLNKVEVMKTLPHSSELPIDAKSPRNLKGKRITGVKGRAKLTATFLASEMYDSIFSEV